MFQGASIHKRKGDSDVRKKMTQICCACYNTCTVDKAVKHTEGEKGKM